MRDVEENPVGWDNAVLLDHPLMERSDWAVHCVVGRSLNALDSCQKGPSMGVREVGALLRVVALN